jgi:hypothetical protein
MHLPPVIVLMALAATPAFLLGGRRRRPHGYGRELQKYRDELGAATARIDDTLGAAAETVEALRHRSVEPEEAVQLLQAHEDELDETATQLEEMLAPEELHGLHMEYEANLERALRGIVTAQRGISITRLPHRPPEDEEPFNYWKRASQNIVHAQMRMREVVEVLISWEPGKPAEVTVSTRLHRA